MKLLSIALTALASAGSVACAHTTPPAAPMPTGVTNAQPIDSITAADRLATAECQRAASCGTIGQGQPHTSMDDCLASAHQDADSELRQDKCPNGVDSTHLQTCESALAIESCSGIVNGFNRRLACRTDALCPW
ncbi:MAG TPA: DUF6184 family natural product biosynthesis lipoprotein [Polyangiaceae bacterium]|jgi:hypothetical protein